MIPDTTTESSLENDDISNLKRFPETGEKRIAVAAVMIAVHSTFIAKK